MENPTTTPLLQESTFTPEFAADNIIGAKALGITPDGYGDDKSRLQPMVEASKIPPYLAPNLADAIDSRSIASVIKPDIDKFNYAERQMGYFSDAIKKGDINRRRNEAAVDIMLNGETEEKNFNLVDLEGQLKDIEESQAKYNLSFAETIPSEVANVATDQYRTIRDEWKTVAAIGAVGATVGGGLGFLGGGPIAAGGGAVGGLITSLRYGPKAAFFKDSVTQTSGEVFSELTSQLDENGRPKLSREQAIPYAMGAGVLIGAIDVVGAEAVVKRVPFLKKFLSPKEFAKNILSPENKVIREGIEKLGNSSFIKDILKGAATEGGTEALQTYVQKAIENVALDEGSGASALGNGIWNTLTDLNTLIEASKAAAIGGVAGGGFVAVGKALPTPKAKGTIENPAIIDDVTLDDQPKLADTLGLNNNLPTSVTEQSYKAYQVAMFVAEQAVLSDKTKFKELTPEEHDKLKARQAEMAGMPSLYADPEALMEFADNEEKAKAVQDAMDNTGSLESGQNVPVRFNTEAAINLQMKYPEFSQILKDSPEGISVNEYRKIIEQRRQAGNQILQSNAGSALATIQEQTVPSISDPRLLNSESLTNEDTMREIVKTKQGYETLKGQFEDQIFKADDLINSEGGKETASTRSLIMRRDAITALATLEKIKDSLPESNTVVDSISQAEEILTRQEISPRELTPGEQTLVDARGDIYLKDIKNKKLSDSQLADLVVTRERAQFVLDELQGEIDDIKAGNDIEIAAQARTPQELEAAVREAKPGKAKIKDGRTVEFIPSVQSNGVPVVTAMIDGKLAGSVRMHLERQNGQNVTTPAMTQVEKDFRRKGVATAMYEYIRENVVRLEHSNIQLPDGKAFAQGSRKKGTGVFKVPDTEKLDAIKKRLTDLQPSLPTYNDGRLRDSDIHTEQQYLNQSIFTKPIEGVLSQSEVDKLNNDVKMARLENVERIDESLEKEWTDVTDFVVNIAEAADRETRAQDIENDPNIEIVENFLNDRIIGVLDETMLARKASGKPMIQIDPTTLTDELRNKYADDPVLKKRKLFGKGGMSLQQAATYFDVTDPEKLLTVLSTTPNREQAVKNAIKLREADTRLEVEMATPLDESSRMKYYDKTAKLHLDELETMKNKTWPTLKNAIKRIALPLPKIEELVARAVQAVNTTPVKLLNAKRYVIGEGKAQKKAVNDVLKGAFESAFSNKQSALLNNILAKESQRMIKKINIANKRLVNIMSSVTQGQLEEAGPEYVKAHNYILDTFHFDPNRKGSSIEDDYQRFADRMMKEGKGDFKIPQGLAERLSGKVDARSLNAEEYLFLVDKLGKIVHQARYKNALTKQYKALVNSAHVEQMQEIAELIASKHPDYDTNKSILDLPPVTKAEELMAWASRGRSTFDNMLSITTYMDQGNGDGFWTRLIYDAIKGIGAFDDGVNGEKAAIKWRKDLQTRYVAAMKKYGMSKFKNMGNRNLDIAEFKTNRLLKYGRLTKAELFTLATHMGNAENKFRLLNYQTDHSTIMRVLEKYLTTEDMDFIQANIWDEYENVIKPRLGAKEISGGNPEPEWTVSEPFTFKGKEYRGGHMPLKYETKGDGRAATAGVQEIVDSQTGKKKLGVKDVQPLHGLVRSPHTEERTGSNWLVSLDPLTIQQGFEDVIYDVSMRDPVKNTLAILSDKKIAKEIQNILGIRKYNQLAEMVAEATRSYNSYEIDLFRDQSAFVKNAADAIQQGHAVASIAFSLPSLLIQGASMRYVISEMGVGSGLKYIGQSALSWFTPYVNGRWGDLVEMTNDIDPAILAFQEGLETKNSNLIRKLSPKDRSFKSLNVVGNVAYNKLKDLQEGMTDLWMESVMGQTDIIMKRITSFAAYKQYMDGNAPNQDLKRFSKMSDSQKKDAAKAYAARVNAKTLTSGAMIDRAALQKTMPGMLFSKYWNDGRNAINHNIQQVDNLRNDMRKAVKAAKAGDFDTFDKHFTDSGERIMRTFFLATIGLGFANMIKSIRWGDEEEESIFLPKEDEGVGYIGRMAYSYFNEMFLQNIPFLREGSFILERYAKSGKLPDAGGPIQDGIEAFATSAKVIGHDYTYNLAQGLTLTDIMEGMTEKDFKGLGLTSSILTGGLPVRGVQDVYGLFSDPDKLEEFKSVGVFAGLFAALFGVAADFVDANDKDKDKTEEELWQEILDEEKAKREGKDSSGIQGYVDEAKQLIAQGTTVNKEDLTDEEYTIIKYAESNNKWNARPKKLVKDEETGKMVWEGEYASSAFGYYQFTEDTWEYIVDNAPKSLGLTAGGLYKSGSKSQQEKAAKWWFKDIISKFKEADPPIAVTFENVYGAHHFGVGGWKKVMSAKNTATIKSVLGSNVLGSNEQIGRRGYKTIKDLKEYVSDQLDIAKGKIPGGDLADN